MAYVDRINFTDVSFDLAQFTTLFNTEMANNDVLSQIGALHNDASLQTYALTSSATTMGYDCYQPSLTANSGSPVVVNYDATLTNATRSVEQTMVTIGRKYSFATNELADYLTLADPELEVAKFTASFWRRQMNKSLIKVLTGSMATSAMSNMVYNISTSGTIASENRLTPTTLLTAIQNKFGAAFKAAGLLVHSNLYKSLVSQNVISYVRTSNSSVLTPTFMGIQLYVDDLLTAGSNSTYTSFMLGEKSIVTADAKEDTPFAIVTDGTVPTRQYLVMKKRFIRQPYGLSFNSTSIGGTSPTDAELAASMNWTLNYTSEFATPVVKLITNV